MNLGDLRFHDFRAMDNLHAPQWVDFNASDRSDVDDFFNVEHKELESGYRLNASSDSPAVSPASSCGGGDDACRTPGSNGCASPTVVGVSGGRKRFNRTSESLAKAMSALQIKSAKKTLLRKSMTPGAKIPTANSTLMNEIAEDDDNDVRSLEDGAKINKKLADISILKQPQTHSTPEAVAEKPNDEDNATPVASEGEEDDIIPNESVAKIETANAEEVPETETVKTERSEIPEDRSTAEKNPSNFSAKSEENPSNFSAKSESNSSILRAKSEENPNILCAKSEQNPNTLRAKSEENPNTLRSKSEENSHDVRAKSEENSNALRAKSEENPSLLRANSEENPNALRSKSEENPNALRSKSEEDPHDVRAKSEENPSLLRANSSENPHRAASTSKNRPTFPSRSDPSTRLFPDKKNPRVRSKNSPKVLVNNVRRHSIAKYRRRASGQYVGLAEAVARFHNETPERFRSANHRDNQPGALPKTKKAKMTLTCPMSPALLCKTRTRAISTSSADPQNRAKNAKSFAQSLRSAKETSANNPNAAPRKPEKIATLTSTTTAAKKKPAMPPPEAPEVGTKTEKPMLTVPSLSNDPSATLSSMLSTSMMSTSMIPESVRKHTPCRKTVPTIVSCDEGKAIQQTEVLHFGIPVGKRYKKITRPIPFSFETRGKEIQSKREKTQQNQEKTQQNPEKPTTKPTAKFAPIANPGKKTTTTSVLKPRENNNASKVPLCALTFQQRNELTLKKKREMMDQIVEREKQARVFHAKPAPHFKPVFVPKKRGVSPASRGQNAESIALSNQENKAPNKAA